MRGISLDKHVAIGGLRPDGLACVDIGGNLVVLVNMLDGTKSRALDSDYAERVYGPFAEIDPSPAFRQRVQMLLDQPGSVPAEQIPKSVRLDTPQMSRQELVEMLEAANLQDMMPNEPTGMQDQDFLDNCVNTIVPQLQTAGIDVADPNLFCSSLYLQRTGLMPYGMSEEPATPPAEMPTAAEAAPPPAPGPSSADNLPPLSDVPPPDLVVAATPTAPAPGASEPAKKPLPPWLQPGYKRTVGKPNKVKNPMTQPAGKPNA
jgi:hypothetical protein